MGDAWSTVLTSNVRFSLTEIPGGRTLSGLDLSQPVAVNQIGSINIGGMRGLCYDDTRCTSSCHLERHAWREMY